MSDYNDRLVEMSENGQNYLLQNTDVTAKLPGFTANFANVELSNTNLRNIRVTREARQSGQNGKNDQKSALLVAAIPMSRKLVAYAALTNNAGLREKVAYTETDLKRLSANELAIKCQVLHDYGIEHLASLGEYGVTSDLLGGLQVNINNYRNALTSKGNSKTALAELDAEEEKYMALLKAGWEKIDLVVELLKENQPKFYAGYKEARRLPATKSRTLSLKVKVFDNADQPLPNATLTLAPTNGSSFEPVVKKTALAGGCNYASIPDGTYTLTAAKPGYKEQMVSVHTVSGEMASVNICLSKA